MKNIFQKILASQNGDKGTVFIDSTTALTKKVSGIFFIADSVVSSSTPMGSYADLSGFTIIGAGTYIGGHYSALELSSGEALGVLK